MNTKAPQVKYVLYVDGRFVDRYSKFKDAVEDAVNSSANSDAIYREVNGVEGKCLRRTQEPPSPSGCYGSW